MKKLKKESLDLEINNFDLKIKRIDLEIEKLNKDFEIFKSREECEKLGFGGLYGTLKYKIFGSENKKASELIKDNTRDEKEKLEKAKEKLMKEKEDFIAKNKTI
jgi:hypothetical protein